VPTAPAEEDSMATYRGEIAPDTPGYRDILWYEFRSEDDLYYLRYRSALTGLIYQREYNREGLVEQIEVLAWTFPAVREAIKCLGLE